MKRKEQGRVEIDQSVRESVRGEEKRVGKKRAEEGERRKRRKKNTDEKKRRKKSTDE